jgi:hypothetical protein
MDFRSLQHIQDSRIHSRGLCLPASFRPQGLATLSTACSPRTRAGFVSRRQRSWDSPFGAFSSRKVSERHRPEAPTYRFSRRCAHRRGDGPDRRAAVSGFRPFRESLAAKRVFSTPAAGCSPGFRPSWVTQPASWPGFRRTSSHVLRGPDDARPARRHLRVSINAGLAPSRRRASTPTGRSHPPRVSAPAQSLPFRRAPVRAMSSPRAEPRVAADTPTLFGRADSPCRSRRDRLGCRAFALEA